MPAMPDLVADQGIEAAAVRDRGRRSGPKPSTQRPGETPVDGAGCQGSESDRGQPGDSSGFMYRTEMNLLRIAIGLAATASLSQRLTPTAAAASVVPPGNSAATQYTETFPTSGGEAAEKNGEINGANADPVQKALGSSKAHRLESKGADGKAVAALTAATAPPGSRCESDGKAPQEPGRRSLERRWQRLGGGGRRSCRSGGIGRCRREIGASRLQQPSGASGLGQVLSQATGSSSGQLGMLPAAG